MEIRTRSFLAFVLVVATASVLSAGPVDVAVLYNGNTQTNRKAIPDLTVWFHRLDRDINLTFFDGVPAPGAIENTEVVLVLSTASPTGLEEVHAEYLESRRDSTPHIVAALRARSQDYNVGRDAAIERRFDVDAVSAATAWPNGSLASLFDQDVRASNQEIRIMHDRWVALVADLIRAAVQR